MSTYTPDKWKLIKINSDTPHYRIFGTWGGSYLHGQSWKLSSGCEDGFYQDGDYWVLPQTSGSIYRIHKDMEGIVGGWFGILDQYQKQIAASGYGSLDIIENPNFSELRFK